MKFLKKDFSNLIFGVSTVVILPEYPSILLGTKSNFLDSEPVNPGKFHMYENFFSCQLLNSQTKINIKNQNVLSFRD